MRVLIIILVVLLTVGGLTLCSKANAKMPDDENEIATNPFVGMWSETQSFEPCKKLLKGETIQKDTSANKIAEIFKGSFLHIIYHISDETGFVSEHFKVQIYQHPTYQELKMTCYQLILDE